MASMREIKRRRDSIESTEQITKAMKLVSTARLQKAKVMAEQARPYGRLLYETIGSVLNSSGNQTCRYGVRNQTGRAAVAAITSNRGLAGGYNTNIVKLVVGDRRFPVSETVIFPVGRKGLEAFERKGYEVEEDYSGALDGPSYEMTFRLASRLLGLFLSGKIDEIYVAYTEFCNTAVQIPRLVRLLPAEVLSTSIPMNFEPDEEAVLDAVIPEYLSRFLYGALLESVASENGARMTAMDSATGNAKEMIEELELLYNRARQGSITQELTEIIAGANAIS